MSGISLFFDLGLGAPGGYRGRRRGAGGGGEGGGGGGCGGGGGGKGGGGRESFIRKQRYPLAPRDIEDVHAPYGALNTCDRGVKH